MTARRTLAAVIGIAAAVALSPASQASAHGAPTDPLSRAFACTVGGHAASGACQAAFAANGGPFGAFDNVRVPGVAGRDRQVIPDGRLCSAGLPEWRGIDLPRRDWPATKFTAGEALSLTYRGTIPHRGTFRIYLTKPGYDPARPLAWSDLPDEPLVTATDPPSVGGAYQLTGRLPRDRTGRHLLYTVWQNSDTPDTYYACSDVDLAAPKGGAANPPAASPAALSSGDANRESRLGSLRDSDDERVAFGRRLMTAALVVLFGVTGALGVLRLRRHRTMNTRRGPG